jgi:hypothetical protein
MLVTPITRGNYLHREVGREAERKWDKGKLFSDFPTSFFNEEGSEGNSLIGRKYLASDNSKRTIFIGN